MRKNVFVIAVASLLVVGLASCVNSMEKDAKEASDFACRSFDVQIKAMGGDEKAMEEIKELETEGKTLGDKFEAKYTTEKDKKSFEEMIKKNMESCDAFMKMKEAFEGLGDE